MIASLIDCHGTGTASAAIARAEKLSMDTDPAPRCVTASLHVDYLKPTPLDASLELRGIVKEVKGQDIMDEKFLKLMEKYFDKDLTKQEEVELNRMLENNKTLKAEFEEQRRIKEVLNKMKLKNPSREAWDSYWVGVYNRIERGIAWVVISIGALIFFGYASYEIVNAFIKDTQAPVLAKLGISLLIFGGLILIFSIIREKIFTSKRDKYKEVQR